MNGKAWKPEHTDTLRRMNAVNYTDEEIAAVTGHCRETVTRNRLAMGLACSSRRGGWRPTKGLRGKITFDAYA